MISFLGEDGKQLDPKDFLGYGGQYLILEEAQKKGIDCQILAQKRNGKRAIFIRLTKGKRSRWISHLNGFFNSKLSCNLALYKNLTYQVLRADNLLIPQFIQLKQLKQLKCPWTIKPVNQTMGRDVFLKIKNKKELQKIAKWLFKKYHQLIVEEFVQGKDYRLLILEGKLIGAVKRIPARIKGDGTHNIKQLINLSNQTRRRTKAKGLSPFLKKIKTDLPMKKYLAQKNLGLNSIPPKNKIIQLRQNANFSTGGEIEDVTNLVHPENIKIAGRAIKAMGLELGGVDVISQDISQPLTKNKGKIIEINAIPSLWLHHFPNYGQGQNPTSQIIDYLFEK
jgi:cyanophycin synthetase